MLLKGIIIGHHGTNDKVVKIMKRLYKCEFGSGAPPYRLPPAAASTGPLDALHAL